MDIREKLQEFKDEVIDQPYEYKSMIAPEIIAYVQKLENRLMSSENLCLWCKHRGTRECVDCVFFSNHESMLKEE